MENKVQDIRIEQLEKILDTVIGLGRRYDLTEEQIDQIWDLINEYDCTESYCCVVLHRQFELDISFEVAFRYLRVTLISGSIVGKLNTHNAIEIQRIIYTLYNEFKVTMDEIDKVKDYCQTVVLPGIDVFKRLHVIYGGGIASFEDAFDKLDEGIQTTKVGDFNGRLL